MKRSNRVICTSCGTAGYPRRRMLGSPWIEILLYLFGFVPGLVYSVWRNATKKWVCGTCERDTIIPESSPVAQQAMRQAAGQQPLNQGDSAATKVPALPLAKPQPLPARQRSQSGLKGTEKTVPGYFIDLLPPELKKAKVPAGGSPPAIPVPASAVPKFGRPHILIPDNFWSNLKQFLTERPVIVRERKDAPFTQTSFGAGLASNLSEFFRSNPAANRPVNSKLAVAWGANFGGFGTRIRDFFSPPKQPPLPPGIRPIKVKDIWSKDEKFGTSQVIAIALHALVVFALLAVPIWTSVVPSTQAKNKQLDVMPLDISPYVAKLPAGADKAGGGGGANNHTLTPTSKGKLPKFQWTQFTPPQAKIQNLNPKLAMDPSLLGPPDLKIPSPNMENYGDPLAKSVTDSLGNGNGTGIGSGSGGGLGPGEGGGTGGGVFRAGINGVGKPECIYCPNPEYSDEARKAKYQGTVLLDVTVTADGRVVNPIVIKGPGLGLEERALVQVKTWRMRPAIGPSGKPVNCRVQIEVTFHLY